MPLSFAPKIAFPTGNTGPLPQNLPFRIHVVQAFDLTNSAIESLSQKAGVQNVMSPALMAELAAKQAVTELGLAAQQDAPPAGLAAVKAATDLLSTGYNELHFRLNGPVNTGNVVTNFTKAETQLQAALDSVGAARPR